MRLWLDPAPFAPGQVIVLAPSRAPVRVGAIPQPAPQTPTPPRNPRSPDVQRRPRGPDRLADRDDPTPPQLRGAALMPRDEKQLRMRLRRLNPSPFMLDAEGADQVRLHSRRSPVRLKWPGDLAAVQHGAKKTVRQLAKSFSKGRRPSRGHLAGRFQRSTVKISYARNLRTKSWAALLPCAPGLRDWAA